jgi:hypothetical protein
MKWRPGNAHTGAAAGIQRLTVEKSPSAFTKAFEVTAFVQRIPQIDSEKKDHQHDNQW